MTREEAVAVVDVLDAATPMAWNLSTTDNPYQTEYIVAETDWSGDPDDPHFHSATEAGEWLAENLERAWRENEQG